MPSAKGCLFWLVGGIAAVMALGVMVPSDSSRAPDRDPPQPSPAARAAQARLEAELRAASNFTLVVNGWRKGGFGAVAEIDLTITNRSDRRLKDVILRCRFSGESGTVILTTERTAYREFPPNQAVRIRGLNFGLIPQEVARAGCEVVGHAQ